MEVFANGEKGLAWAGEVDKEDEGRTPHALSKPVLTKERHRGTPQRAQPNGSAVRVLRYFSSHVPATIVEDETQVQAGTTK